MLAYFRRTTHFFLDKKYDHFPNILLNENQIRVCISAQRKAIKQLHISIIITKLCYFSFEECGKAKKHYFIFVSTTIEGLVMG